MTNKEAFEQWWHSRDYWFKLNDGSMSLAIAKDGWEAGYLAGRNDQKQKDAEIASTFRCGTCGMDGKVSDAILNQGD